MWSPRRIFLTLAGLVFLAGAYFGYARMLGGFDGLPPLPAHFRYDPAAKREMGPIGSTNSLEQKFELAFGLGCPELTTQYPIRLFMEGKGILVAAQDFKIQKDTDPRPGWVLMTPLSLAMIGKKRGPDGVPEINTMYCDFAFLKFDKPIKAVADMSGSKIIQAELHADPEAKSFDARRGRIHAINNRRTVDPNDDIDMETPGPVYYEANPSAGKPNIYTFTAVQMIDHLNSDLPAPDKSIPRPPTVAGIGLRIFLTPEEKTPKTPAKTDPKLPIPRKEPKPGLSGVDVVELDNTVAMHLWTDANASFVAPSGELPPKKEPKAETKKVEPKKLDPKAGPKKDAPPVVDKRLLQIKTNGPFRYDLRSELAHFEKPAVSKPGILEQVTVTRAGRTTGEDLLLCDFLDVQFNRKPPTPLAKDSPPKAPVPKKDAPPAGDGDLEIKTIKAWGETVVVNSDSENIYATGVEMTHDNDAHVTILKGDANQRMRAVKDGNLLEGQELHLFGDGKEISQAHVLGEGSIGFGEVDPKTGAYLKTATWTDRFLYTKEIEKDKPPLDVLTFIGKAGAKAVFTDRTTPEVQRIEAHQLKVWLLGQDKNAKKDPPKKEVVVKKGEPKADATKSARPTRLEATGEVRGRSADAIIKQADYLNVWFTDVVTLIKPPEAKKGPVTEKGPLPRVVDPPPVVVPIDPKAPVAKKEEPKVEPKKPLVIVAKTIETWVNRSPQNQMELDRAHAEGDVDIQQDAAKAGDPPTHVAGATVDMKAFADGNRLLVTGDQTDPKAPKWGMVKNDKLTMFGFDITIDQPTNTSHVNGEGSMEILSGSTLEGKKLAKPTPMTVYWKHKMDFRGSDKLIDYHGTVQAYQENNRLKCEWMQVLLDRPVYLNQALKTSEPVDPKAPPKKKEDDSPKVDTILAYHTPRDEDVPKPRDAQPVLVVEETRENGRIVKYQSIQAPDIQSVNSPKADKKVEHEMTATSSSTMPGVVRMWQAGSKDALADNKIDAKKDPKKVDPKKKGELRDDEEMKLTVVQFGDKMKATDYRKHARFYKDIRAVHLAADRPTIPVELREGQIPEGAVYLECRDTLEVFATMQKELREGKLVDVQYQEMIGVGAVRVRKQGQFFGDANKVTYSELKGTLTFHGTEKNPAVVYELRGQGVPPKEHVGRIVTYYTKSKTIKVEDATQIKN